MIYTQYKIKSKTNSSKIYKVRIYNTFEICDCEGFKFRKNCRHIKEALQKYNLIKPNQKKYEQQN